MAGQNRRKRNIASRSSPRAAVRRRLPGERQRLRTGEALDPWLAEGSAGGGGNLDTISTDNQASYGRRSSGWRPDCNPSRVQRVKRKDGKHAQQTLWYKILNPAYTQKAGRQEFFQR